MLNDESGDSDIIDTAVALVLILGLFFAFFIYSTAAREKVVMNYSAKEGARAYMISKNVDDGIDTAKDYLRIGGVSKYDNVSEGENSIRIEKRLGIYVPFFQESEVTLVSEVEFHEELDPSWYQRDQFSDGWRYERWRKGSVRSKRKYEDDAVKDPYR